MNMLVCRPSGLAGRAGHPRLGQTPRRPQVEETRERRRRAHCRLRHRKEGPVQVGGRLSHFCSFAAHFSHPGSAVQKLFPVEHTPVAVNKQARHEASCLTAARYTCFSHCHLQPAHLTADTSPFPQHQVAEGGGDPRRRVRGPSPGPGGGHAVQVPRQGRQQGRSGNPQRRVQDHDRQGQIRCVPPSSRNSLYLHHKAHPHSIVAILRLIVNNITRLVMWLPHTYPTRTQFTHTIVKINIKINTRTLGRSGLADPTSLLHQQVLLKLLFKAD